MTVRCGDKAAAFGRGRAKRLLAFLTSARRDFGNCVPRELIVRKQFSSLPVADRFDIVHSLASARTELVRRLLVNVLRVDPSPLVRHEAAFVLGCLGGRKQAMAVRMALKSDTSFLVRHEAAMALAEIGAPEDIPTLTARLADRSPEVSISCHVALVRIRERSIQAH